MSTEQPTALLTLDGLRLESEQRQMRLVFWILLSFPLVFGIAELLLNARSSQVLLATAAIRLALLALILLMIERLRRMRSRTAYTRAVTLTLSASVVLLLAQHMLRPRTELLPFVLEVLVITSFYAFIPNRGYRQAVVSGALTAGSLALLYFWHDDVAPAEYIGITTSLLAANALGVSSIWHRLQREKREEGVFAREQEARGALERTLAELRVLRGILPICAHCRMIRADDGVWDQLDNYVRTHTDADFSHGICPTCLEEHYPTEDVAPPPVPT
jgi:hypothetical protein